MRSKLALFLTALLSLALVIPFASQASASSTSSRSTIDVLVPDLPAGRHVSAVRVTVTESDGWGDDERLARADATVAELQAEVAELQNETQELASETAAAAATTTTTTTTTNDLPPPAPVADTTVPQDVATADLTVPPLGAGCALWDANHECERPRPSSIHTIFDLEAGELSGFTLACGSCSSTPAIYSSASSSSSSGGSSPASLSLLAPMVEVDGDSFGMRFSVTGSGYLFGHGLVGMNFPIEAELHHRFGSIEPSVGLEAFYFTASNLEQSGAIQGGELSARVGVRLFLTPTTSILAWGERSIAGSYPMSGVGLALGLGGDNT